VVISRYWPGGPTAKAAPQANRLLVHSELPMWALRTFAAPLLARIAGVPKGFPQTAADADLVTGIIGSMFPVVPRAEGVIFDFFVSFPEINHYDLEAVTVPAVIVHATDDPVAPYHAAQQAAGRIPRARLLRMDRGGHVMLGQQEAVKP
jgi:pimeloyl-ACP methyl ester carboxylesterase